MLRRRFGRTEIQIPVLSCGGMRYQQHWKDIPLSEVTPENQANLEATIRRAVELGINHIETARGYGSSERQLGLILPQFPRNEIIVQTKIAPEEGPEKFRANFAESLERLQLSHVDLLAIHGINNDELLDESLKEGGYLDVCEDLKRQGLARNIGFSTHGPLDTILRAIRTGRFDYVNLHWYFIYQQNWPAVIEARAQDMGVFIISPSDKGGMLYKAPEKLHTLTAPVHPIAFNNLFCLLRPEVHTLSLGAAKPSDFDEHIESLRLYGRAQEIVEPIVARLEEEMVKTVGEDYAHHYLEGLPRWEETPGEINLPIILWLRNLALAYDMKEYAQMRYNLLGNAGHWFAGRNAEKAPELDLAGTLKNYRFADRIPELLAESHAMLYKAPAKRLSES